MTSGRIHIRQDELIAHAYEQWRGAVLGYVLRRIGRERHSDAEDLVQDAFLQLLSYDTVLMGEQIRSLLYKVARNLVIDYLRHHACTVAAQEYFQGHANRVSRCTEEEIAADELERLESETIARMPGKKARVFILYVHEGKSVKEISESLHISARTVENHIFRARCDIRETIKAS